MSLLQRQIIKELESEIDWLKTQLSQGKTVVHGVNLQEALNTAEKALQKAKSVFSL